MSTEVERQGEVLVLPSPVFRGAHMVRALADYQELQKALDDAMPDQILSIGTQRFRKKRYWRAIRVAFNLTVECVTPESQERSTLGTLPDGTENYLYGVTYRATAPNGSSAVGDGACAAAEKQKGRMEATEHNVRSHAHTRAFNRAVSNLVGFGEVSAEEVERDEHGETAPAEPTNPDGSTKITKVEEIAGKTKGGKAFVRFVVTCADGRSGSTFDAKLAAEAKYLHAAGAVTVPRFEQSGQYTNLMGFAEPGTPPPQNGKPTVIGDHERNKFWGVAKEHGWPVEEAKTLYQQAGFEHLEQITVEAFPGLVQRLKDRRKEG